MTIMTEIVSLLVAGGNTTEDIKAMFDQALAEQIVTFPPTPIDRLLASHGHRMNDKQRQLCVGIADFTRNRPPTARQIDAVNNVALCLTGSKIM